MEKKIVLRRIRSLIGYNPYDPNVGRNPMNPVSAEGGQANFKKRRCGPKRNEVDEDQNLHYCGKCKMG